MTDDQKTEETKPEETIPLIEPGDQFDVGYGNGKRTSVVALSLSGQRKLAAIYQKMIAAENSNDPAEVLGLFDLAEQAIRLAKPDVTDEFIESIDAENVTTIVTNCLGKQSLGPDDKKKSESPH